MKRNARERLDAIPNAIAAGEAFRSRVAGAAGDPETLALLMAEAIQMHVDANGLEVIGRDGRLTMCVEALQADYCMIDARKAFLAAISQRRAS